MVNVVGPESGTVAAPPESVFSLKLPSGEEMVHDATPALFQKTEVRVPSGTLAGTAQISTCGATVETVVGADVVGVGVGAKVVCWITGCAGGAGVPTWYPRHAQRLSKKEGGITYETMEPAHGRFWHIPATIPCGFAPNVSEP